MAADVIKFELNLTCNKNTDVMAYTIKSFIVVEATVYDHKRWKTKSYIINSKFEKGIQAVSPVIHNLQK